MNALLGKNTNHTTANPNGLRIAGDDVRYFSTVPTAHVRDLVSDGVTGNGLAVYFAIADRQVDSMGEYFRSNEKLAEETGVSVRTVQHWLGKLKSRGYLSLWYVNGGRRMRVLTRVQPLAPKGATTRTHPCEPSHPYKENNIKKTTQQENTVCCSFSLSEKHRAFLGESEVTKLVATFGLERVERGLLAWDATDQPSVTNPIGWLKRAIIGGWEPKKTKPIAARFSENTFDHDKYISDYVALSDSNTATVNQLIDSGMERNRVAFKIWKGTV
jgi:biotin operon repressor